MYTNESRHEKVLLVKRKSERIPAKSERISAKVLIAQLVVPNFRKNGFVRGLCSTLKKENKFSFFEVTKNSNDT